MTPTPLFDAAGDSVTTEVAASMAGISEGVGSDRLLAPPDVDRACILVTGMHRSGTSATAGVISGLGAATGDRLVPPNRWNERGHFELQSAVDINDRCLSAFGLGWDTAQPLPRGWKSSRAAKEASEAIEAVFSQQLASFPLCMVKDPRLCRLLPLWLDVMARQDVTPYIVIALRSPYEVAASLDVRDGISAEQAHALWLLYMLEVERHSRSYARVVIEYGRLLRDWRSEVSRMVDALGLRLGAVPQGTRDAIDQFLSRKLRHHDEMESPPLVRERFPTAYRVMKEIEALSNGSSDTESVLDSVHGQLAEGMALWSNGGAASGCQLRQRRSMYEVLELLELPRHSPRQNVLALYWRDAGDDYEQERSVSCEYPDATGSIVRVTLGVPCAAIQRFLRVDPAMAAGIYRVTGLAIGDTSIDPIPLVRVNGMALAERRGELLRLFADHDDPWFEIDLHEMRLESPGDEVIQVRVDIQRVGLADSLARRLDEIEDVVRALASARNRSG